MKTNKLLSVILSLVITISSLSFAAVSASAAEITPVTPQTDSSGVYQISSAAELYWFAGLVNGTLTGIAQNTSANAVLTADITVNENVLKADGTLNSGTFNDWTPIGNDFNQYIGKFDGQGHTISGLYFNNPSTDYVGLFGYLGTDGEIKNVGVIDSYFSCYGRVGGVCGINYGTITGCYNTGTVTGTGDNVGGVCGDNWQGTITGCYNTGTVSGDWYVGGVCGNNFAGTITGCYNTGTVSGTNYVGGVCGGYGGSSGTITGCYNTGTVRGNNGSFYVGGVCGWNGYTIIGCYNTGTVSGGSGNYVGGVCGRNYNGAITGCYNTGTVSDGSDNYVGGVCGYNYKGKITGCYTNNGGVCGVDDGTVTDCEEYTGDEFKDGTVCVLLNKAIGSSYDVTFYQGEEIPLFFSNTENRYCTVNYAVAPSYTVIIPETVTLGDTATIKADDVLLDEDKQLEVSLTGTSGVNNAFTVTSPWGTELEYTVNDGTKDISINDTVLTVNPDDSNTGSVTLSFNTPSDSDITYAGDYFGTVTFTVSVL